MSLANVAIVALIAVAAPVLARSVRFVSAVPVIVVEILAGVALGPQVLGWLSIDQPLDTLAVLGVTFLFFLAGLEVDLRSIRGRVLDRSLAAYAAGLGLALGAATALHALGLLDAPVLVGVALSATGLGLVIPILRDAGVPRLGAGGVPVAMASVAEFAAVVVLAVAFSASGRPSTDVAILLGLVALAIVTTLAAERIRTHAGITRLVERLSGGTVQLRVRLSVALVVGFAALAEAGGLEVVLGAFFAGGILNVLDGAAMATPAYRDRLDGLGYGFLVPVFFVVSGARLDFSALSWWPGCALLVPLLFASLLAARAVPSAWLAPDLGRSDRVGVGLLCATSLPFIVTATQVGVATGRLDASTAAAMTAAGLAAVCVLPPLAVRLLGDDAGQP